jgi:rSAM/selenodomain-associated transferase 1
MIRRTLVIMIKEPRPGRVKTRLGREIGMTCAAWWFRHQVRSLLRRIADPRWRVVLAVSPDNEGLTSRIWPARFQRVAQGRGDLGDRMRRAFKAFDGGPVCIIGADIPGIQRHHIAEAFRVLGRHDAVFGPAMDGGYWLVGLRHPNRIPRGMFDGVRWSTADALSDTIDTIGGCSIGYVASLKDVDRAADL